MQAKNVWLGLVALVVALAAVSAAIIVIYAYTNSQFLLGILGIGAAIVTASVQYRAAKEKENDARLFAERRHVYTELMETLMNLFHQRKSNPTTEEQAELTRKLQELRTKLLIWGGAKTIKALDRMSEMPSTPEQLPIQGTLWLSDLYAAVRSDLGHNDPPEAAREMALGLLKSPDRALLREALAKLPRNAS